MIEKMMDPNIIDYYVINCAIPSIITIEKIVTKSILASHRQHTEFAVKNPSSVGIALSSC